MQLIQVRQWLRWGFYHPAILHTFLYGNHARRLRLKKLLYIEISRSPNGFFEPVLDPGGGLNFETAERRLQK
jgi:hypothetical protein